MLDFCWGLCMQVLCKNACEKVLQSVCGEPCRHPRWQEMWPGSAPRAPQNSKVEPEGRKVRPRCIQERLFLKILEPLRFFLRIWRLLRRSWRLSARSWESLGGILGGSWEDFGDMCWPFGSYLGAWRAYFKRLVEFLKNHQKPCKV